MRLTDGPIWQMEGKMLWLTFIVACLAMGLAITAVCWVFNWLARAARNLFGV